jgi:hypothetical protein
VRPCTSSSPQENPKLGPEQAPPSTHQPHMPKETPPPSAEWRNMSECAIGDEILARTLNPECSSWYEYSARNKDAQEDERGEEKPEGCNGGIHDALIVGLVGSSERCDQRRRDAGAEAGESEIHE